MECQWTDWSSKQIKVFEQSRIKTKSIKSPLRTKMIHHNQMGSSAADNCFASKLPTFPIKPGGKPGVRPARALSTHCTSALFIWCHPMHSNALIKQRLGRFGARSHYCPHPHQNPSLRPLSSMKGAQNNLCAISTPVLKWSDLTPVIIFVQSKEVYTEPFNIFLTFYF